MNQLIIYIAIFIAAYVIDISTAMLHKKYKPNNFQRIEGNERFKKCINAKGFWKGMFAYIILSSSESIVLFASVWITAWFIFSATFYQSIMFSFLFMGVAHALCTITNLLALMKKERVIPSDGITTISNTPQLK